MDQGGPSAPTFNGFREFIVEASKTRVLCFISSYLAGGLLGHRYVDLYGPTGINVNAIVKCARDNPELIKGIKAHAEPGGYSRWGLESLKLGKQASRELGFRSMSISERYGLRKMASASTRATIIEEVVPLLDAGDVLAHPFTRYPSGFVGKDGSIHPLIREAQQKGVTIDVGRGAHFSFDNARAVLGAGILPDTLGADLHGYNVKFPDGGRWYRGMFNDTDEMEPPEESTLPFSTPIWFASYHERNARARRGPVRGHRDGHLQRREVAADGGPDRCSDTRHGRRHLDLPHAGGRMDVARFKRRRSGGTAVAASRYAWSVPGR